MTGIGDVTQNKQKNTKAENRQDTHTPIDTHFPFCKHLAAHHTLHNDPYHSFLWLRLPSSTSFHNFSSSLSGDNLLQRILGHILKFRTSSVATLRLASARKDQQLGEIHLQTVHISPRATPRNDFFAIDRRQCQWCEPSLDSPLRFATLQG